MDKLERTARNIKRLPMVEQRGIRKAMRRPRGPVQRALVANVVADIVTAVVRVDKKRTADRRGDSARRILIGARLRREDADRCRAAAALSGRSLYRFVMDALEREVDITQKK